MKRMLLPELSKNPGVLSAIDEELRYINDVADDRSRSDGRDHGVTGQLLAAEEYLLKARTAWVNNAGEMPTLDILRKVAGICIRALISEGCPRRNQ